MFRRKSSKDILNQTGYGQPGGGKISKKLIESAPITTVTPDAKLPVHSRKSSGTPPSLVGAAVRTASTVVDTPPASAEMARSQVPVVESSPVIQKVSAAAVSKTSASRASSSKVQSTPEPPSNSLVVGEGVLFEGSTEGCAAAVVAGKLKGKVKSARLEIMKQGRMDGTAIVETAEVAGVFEGKLRVAKGLKICSSGKVKGEVTFGSIVVENGGKLEGKVNFGDCRDSSVSDDPKRGTPSSSATETDGDSGPSLEKRRPSSLSAHRKATSSNSSNGVSAMRKKWPPVGSSGSPSRSSIKDPSARLSGASSKGDVDQAVGSAESGQAEDSCEPTTTSSKSDVN